MCLKGILRLSFHGQKNLAEERLMGGKHLTSSKTETPLTIDFKLCTHISNRMKNKIMSKFFLAISHSLFIGYNSTSFESVFCMKTAKRRLQKKHQERRKSQDGFICPWLVRYQCKYIIENCNPVAARVYKVGKIVSLFLRFDPCFPDIPSA